MFMRTDLPVLRNRLWVQIHVHLEQALVVGEQASLGYSVWTDD